MSEDSKRPNILLITSDQQRGDCFGFEGSKVRTPHLDTMARDGTRFSNCITPNVVCQPSRASILTGLLPLTHGVHDNGIDLSDNLADAGFSGQFSRAGYKTGFIGKAHFSTFATYEPTGRPENVKSSDQYGNFWFGPYAGFDHVELMISGHWHRPPETPPLGMHFESWYYGSGNGDELNRLYRTKLEPDIGAAQTFHSALPVAFHTSTWVGDRTIRYLQDNRDEPFCAWASFPDPHHPFDAPEPWSRMHHPDDVDLPEHRTRDFDQRPWWHKIAMEGEPSHPDPDMKTRRQKWSRVPNQTDEQLRHLIANYFGMISLIDHNVGRILMVLDELGLSENTIVIYTTDHGDWLGDHGLLLKGPMHYEGLLRVGMIWKGPGIPKGKIVKDPVSTLDLSATLFDYGNTSAPQDIHGRSLRPLIETDSASRDHAYNEWYLLPTRCGVELELRTVRTKSHKLTIEMKSGAGELYDLENDPLEMKNLFGDPAVEDIQKELNDMIRARPDDIMDPLPVQVGNA